jgi:hypothetical protein
VSQPRRDLLLLGVLAQGGDELVLAHRGATLDLQLTGPVAQLVDTALLEAAPVRLGVLLAVLPARLGLGGLDLAGGRLLGALGPGWGCSASASRSTSSTPRTLSRALDSTVSTTVSTWRSTTPTRVSANWRWAASVCSARSKARSTAPATLTPTTGRGSRRVSCSVLSVQTADHVDEGHLALADGA